MYILLRMYDIIIILILHGLEAFQIIPCDYTYLFCWVFEKIYFFLD